MAEKFVIAVDLGAESGRVMRAALVDGKLQLSALHRFPNNPVKAGDRLYWDALRLWHEITAGIRAAGGGAAGVAVDAWGVDTALLDRDGRLLSNPVHYRDPRTDGMMDWVFERAPRREVFERTGIQFMQINGLYQNASLIVGNSPLLDAAATLLTLPDLFNYWLSGAKSCEFTDATTTQMYNPRARAWDTTTLDAIGFPTRLLTEVVEPGTRLGIYEGIPVYAVASHDTGSAVVAVPATTEHYAYLSSGTWSLIGLEVPAPIITDATYAANLTNEGGAYNTIRLLKNVMGLWLAQQCRATWAAAGQVYEYDQLVGMATESAPFRSLFDPDAPEMLQPGDMPARIRAYCARTGQPEPETPGQVMRAVYESLALKYRHALDNLIAVSERRVEKLHVIGGGSQNALLCQMTADAIARPVIAGPTEATAAGNAVVQLIALGELANLAEARQMLSETFETVTYTPKYVDAWEAEYQRFCALPLAV
jgi:rhamnulokinase